MPDSDGALYRALLSAFPDHGSLERMLRFRMDLSLDEVSSGSLSDRVFAVVRFAAAQGRLDELVRAALEDNPANPELRAVAQLREARVGQAAAAHSQAAPTPPAVDKRVLRAVMVEHYSLEELQLLCADLEEDLRSAGLDVRLSLDDLAGATKIAKVLSLVEYVDRRRRLDRLVAMVQRQRPGIL